MWLENCQATNEVNKINPCKQTPNFKKATEKSDKHLFQKQFHKLAVQGAMVFCTVQQNRLPNDQQLNIQTRTYSSEPCQALVNCHIFRGRQGIAIIRMTKRMSSLIPFQITVNFWHS